MEAILAASFLSGGHEAALQAARRLEIPIPGVAQWSDYGRLAAEDATQAQAQVNTTLPPHGTVQALELMVGSPIGRPDLLGQALVRRRVVSPFRRAKLMWCNARLTLRPSEADRG